MLAEVCRQCMITMDIDCISGLCILQNQRISISKIIDVSISGDEIATQDVEHHGKPAIAAMHGPNSLVRFGD